MTFRVETLGFAAWLEVPGTSGFGASKVCLAIAGVFSE